MGAYLTVPLMVLPPVYELPFMGWRWCRLYEVCALVPTIAGAAETSFAPTPEELVSRFAALTPRHKPPKNVSQEEAGKKIFRFAKDLSGYSSIEVPTGDNESPPYTPFRLPISSPYPKGLFVLERWVVPMLRAVRQGAVAAADFGEYQIGFLSPSADREPILLNGERKMRIIRIPPQL